MQHSSLPSPEGRDRSPRHRKKHPPTTLILRPDGARLTGSAEELQSLSASRETAEDGGGQGERSFMLTADVPADAAPRHPHRARNAFARRLGGGALADPYQRARLWRYGGLIALVLVVLGCAIGIPLFLAAGHYARGLRALEAHAYKDAAAEFSGARFLGLAYKDAQLLEESARRSADVAALQIARDRADVELAQRFTVVRQRLQAGDVAGLLSGLKELDTVELQNAALRPGKAHDLIVSLRRDVATAGRTALRARSWLRAQQYSAALLLLDPASETAKTLAADAKKGLKLSAQLREAKKAAQQGDWQSALQRALAVRAVQADFPGVADLIREAQIALRPKPKPAPVVAHPTPPHPAPVPPPRPPAPQPAPAPAPPPPP